MTSRHPRLDDPAATALLALGKPPAASSPAHCPPVLADDWSCQGLAQIVGGPVWGGNQGESPLPSRRLSQRAATAA